MDSLVVRLTTARDESGFEGTVEEFRSSPKLLAWAKKTGKIVRLLPTDMPRALREKYTDYLVEKCKEYLAQNPEITDWQVFSSRTENAAVQKIFHNFGVRAAVFSDDTYNCEEADVEVTSRHITLQELYELYVIFNHYDGTLASFKRAIQRQYGSFAEYCILKNYDINKTTWENDEIAIRVARKLGSVEEIKKRARTLFKYLEEKEILNEVFEKEAKAS